MANINHAWRRVMAVGCSHGNRGNIDIQQQVIAFSRTFKPQVRFHLGDIVDTAAYRSGAKGTKDEFENPEIDQEYGLRFLREYEPNRIAWGNHDVRLEELSTHPNGIISHSARILWNQLQDEARRLKAKTVPYDVEEGWFSEGGVFWGHGYVHNMHALYSTAAYLGGPTVMAHKHVAEQTHAMTRYARPSFCVGTLADIPAMHYARRRHATSRWSHGVVYGEISDKGAKLWLAQGNRGSLIQFPPGVM